MSTLADNAWHHIAMTLDGTGNASGIKFYLDGTLISGAYGGATGTGMNVTDTADSFLIGSKPSLANPFHGSIDDFRVYGSALDEATISGIANIAIAPPVADFSADTTTPTVGDIVTFTDASTGNPTSWTWDFGDATVVGDETAQNPQVSFQTPGTYSVTLTASNAGGDSAPLVKTDYITVSAGTGSGDLQAQYNFDGDLTDASSYGRDLSPVGAFSPTYEADADTNASSALTTSGVYADHLITGYPGIGSGNARTVTAWFKTTGTARESIVSWGKDASGQMFNVMIHDGVPRIEGGSSSLLTSDTGLNDDNWHHIAVTYDPADGDKLANCKIYIDGNLSSNLADGASLSYQSATTVINTNITTNFLKIGSAVYNTYTFHGAVDDVRIYSKALTPSEIAQVMNRQTLSTIKNEMTQTIKVFPTQVSSYLNVKTKTSEGLSVSVYNILGRMVKATSIDQNETSIDMSTLSAGLYIVKVKSGEQVSTVKVIKE
jgi:PKD repeat protein